MTIEFVDESGDKVEGKTLVRRIDIEENNRLLAANTQELIAHSHRQDTQALLLKIIAGVIVIGIVFSMWVVGHIIKQDVIGNIIRGLA